jgi:hypothetical protein
MFENVLTLKAAKFFEFAVSNVIKALRADFVSRFCSATFSGRWTEVGHGVFFAEQFTAPWIQLFGKQNSDQTE